MDSMIVGLPHKSLNSRFYCYFSLKMSGFSDLFYTNLIWNTSQPSGISQSCFGVPDIVRGRKNTPLYYRGWLAFIWNTPSCVATGGQVGAEGAPDSKNFNKNREKSEKKRENREKSGKKSGKREIREGSFTLSLCCWNYHTNYWPYSSKGVEYCSKNTENTEGNEHCSWLYLKN